MSKLRLSLCAMVAILTPASLALALNPTPTFINVYWVQPGSTWDVDVREPPSNFSGTGADSNMITRDFLDSYLTAFLRSDYYDDLKLWGVNFAANSPLPSMEVSECGGPPANIDSALTQWRGFVDCVLKLNNNALMNVPGLTVNVFLPPWVLPTTEVLPDGGIIVVPGKYCSQGNALAENTADNGIDGHGATFIPTNGFGADAGVTGGCYTNWVTGNRAQDPNSGSVLGALTHEDVEVTACQICDLCEHEPPAYNVRDQFVLMACSEYQNFTNQSACTPDVNAESFSMQAPTGFVACGSGQNMKFQAQFDPARYDATPWDVTAGFGSSMYVGIEDVTRAWSAGFSHFPNSLDAVQITDQTWNHGLITVSGFAEGYSGYNLGTGPWAQAGDTWQMTAYDPHWGRPSVTAQVPSEWGFSISVVTTSGDRPYVGIPTDMPG